MFAYWAYFITEINGREVVRVKKMFLGEVLQKRHLKQKIGEKDSFSPD